MEFPCRIIISAREEFARQMVAQISYDLESHRMLPHLLCLLAEADLMRAGNSAISQGWGMWSPQRRTKSLSQNPKLNRWDSICDANFKVTTTGYSKSFEMSPQQFTHRVHDNWRNRLQATQMSMLESMKTLTKIALGCVETIKYASRRPSVHDILVLLDSGTAISATVDINEMKPLPACIPTEDSVDLVLDSDGSALAPAPSMHQHLSLSNQTDERSHNTRSNRAPATNSSDETTRAPMAHKLTGDEAENHSDPDSCFAERDTIEEAKRSGEWFFATGAAHHATGDPNLITNLLELENDDLCVHAADGTPMPVRGCGNVETDTVVLPNVYYVPGLWTNLVSVGQLAGLDYCVGFGRGACVVSDAAGTVVGRAHARGDGLYEVDFLRVPLGMP